MKWNGIDNINLNTKPPAGGGGASIEAMKGLLSDDLVFKMFFPIETGIQAETEILYPDEGRITDLFISVPIGSIISSNYVIVLQKYDNSSKLWVGISSTMMYVGEYEKVVSIDDHIINNNRLRLSVNEGMVGNMDGITVICRIKPLSGESVV